MFLPPLHIFLSFINLKSSRLFPGNKCDARELFYRLIAIAHAYSEQEVKLRAASNVILFVKDEPGTRELIFSEEDDVAGPVFFTISKQTG